VYFEDQNKVLESSTMIINYPIIIISAYYLINALYNYYISNKDLLEEYDKEENLEVTGSCYFLLNKKKKDCKTFCPVSPIRRVTAKTETQW